MIINPTVKIEDFTVETMWDNFAKQVLVGLDKDSVQYKEMKRAFICGVFDALITVEQMAVKLTVKQAEKSIRSLMRDSVKFISGIATQKN